MGVVLHLALAVAVAQAAVPVGPSGDVLGPAGVAPVVLADLPDLEVQLSVQDGFVVLVEPSSGIELSDGSWPPDTVTPWAEGGVERLVRADASGRVTRVVWGSGRRMDLVRDADGRVIEVTGPGTARRRVTYTNGVQVEDTLGSGWLARQDADRSWVIRDGSGRQVRVEVDPATNRIVSWEDPRGGRTSVRQVDDLAEVVGPGGAVWRVSTTSSGGFVEQPDGLRWTWQSDTEGRLASMSDPLGLEGRWRYDSAGRLVRAELGGRNESVTRDPDGRILDWTSWGGTTAQLRWDGGRVTQVVDPTGAAVVLERDGVGRVDAVLSRTGGRWELDYDLDGQVQGVVDPVGRTLELRRDGAGRITGVTYEGQNLRIDRDSAGRVVGVVDPRGVRTGLVRESTGRLREVRWPGQSMRIERDSAGEVVGVRHGTTEVFVRRDAAGRPISAGPIAWTRDIMGRVDRLASPGIDFLFQRDVVGRLTAIRAGDSTLAVQRNLVGEPMRWSGGHAPVRVERDAAGRVVMEEVGGDTSRASRGARGHTERVDSHRGTWHWSRGPDGSVLRVEGPDGVGVGTDRDEAGRVVLARLPGGGIVRRVFQEGVVMEQVDAAGGEVVTRAAWSPDLTGQLAWAQVDDAPRLVWKTASDGSLVAIESGEDEESAWYFGPHLDRGPGGWVRVADLLGRTTELMVGETWPAWGAIGGAWAYERAPTGALTRITGAEGAFDILHDAFGKLVGVTSSDTHWTIEWDAMGRPHRLNRPGGPVGIHWAPGQVSGTPLATGPGADTAWIDSTTGAVAWSRARASTVGGGAGAPSAGAALLPGNLGARLEDALGLMPIRWGHQTGVADSAGLDPIGGRGGISVFTGGPELFTGGALDPASCERTDGTLDWPWVVDAGDTRVSRTVWDPSGWRAESRWGEPLQLAHQLGLIELPETSTGPAAPVAYPWLPAALDAQVSTFGPTRGRIPVEAELEPIVGRILLHLMNGEGAVSWEVVLGDVMPSDALGHLPPGVFISGVHGAAVGPDPLVSTPLSKKVVAGWDGLL